MLSVDSKVIGIAIEHRNPINQSADFVVWKKAKHGFIVMERFHVALRCWRELFMLYKDYMSTVGEPAFSFRSV